MLRETFLAELAAAGFGEALTIEREPGGFVDLHRHPFEARAAESARIKEKFAGRVPVIVERAPRSAVPDIDKSKFLVPADLTVGQFCFIVRKRLSLPPESALFVFVVSAKGATTLPPTGQLIRELYAASGDPDGFLYCLYAGESTFGGPAQR